MGDRHQLTLKRGQTGEAAGRRVTFVDCTDVHFGGGMPPESALLFDVAEGGGDPERVTLSGESDWAGEHRAAGVVLRVRTAYAHRVDRVEIEVEPA